MKLWWRWLLVGLLSRTASEACRQQCQLCAAASETYIWSPCEGRHCLAGQNCTVFCESCREVYFLCSVHYPAASSCHSSSQVCGSQSLFTGSSGKLSVIDYVAPLTLCSWTLDLRDSIQLSSQDYVKLTLTLGDRVGLASGRPSIAAYTIFTGEKEPELSAYTAQVYSLSNTTALQLSIRCNYLYFSYRQISYWTEANDIPSVGLTVNWDSEGNSDPEVPSTANILIIAAVSMVSTTALFCCILCLYKFLKARQRRRLYIDRTDLVLLFNDRTSGRHIAEVRPSIVITKEQIDQCMPVHSFQSAMLETGEQLCTICIEE